MTEDEIIGWYHQLNGHEFEQASGVGDGQGSLACCSLWSQKELDTTEQLNRTDPLLVGEGACLPLDRCLPPSAQVDGIQNKANFPFHQLGLFTGF